MRRQVWGDSEVQCHSLEGDTGMSAGLHWRGSRWTQCASRRGVLREGVAGRVACGQRPPSRGSRAGARLGRLRFWTPAAASLVPAP